MAAQVDIDDSKRPKGMRINSRLVGLLVVPLVVLVALTGFGVVQGITQSREAAELSDRTALAASAYQLIDELEAERSTLVADSMSTPDRRAAVRAASDELAARAEQVGGSLQRETDAVLRRISGVQRLSEGEIGGRSALRSFSVTIEELLDLSTRAIDPAGAVDGAAASTTDYLARAQAASAQESDLVSVLQAEGEIDAVSFQELSSLAASQRAYSALAAETAPGALSIRIRQVAFAISAADEVRRDAFVATVTPSFDGWSEGLATRTTALTELREVAEGAAVAAVDDLSTSSRLLLLVASLAMIAILLISALLLRRANRTIARPLQDLARQAEDVADHRLPAAVRARHSAEADVHLAAVRATGAAEVHEVAAAFNAVQDTALRLAGEQAALRVNQSEAMTNLGRRNQTLLARQLDFITSLETRETDPEFLEHLFKLDHLASRMRRNAESLLILAGSETPRRRRSPAPVAEVVRAAMSEVEEFERVRIGSLSDATVSGPVVIDLVHLLAELIENALNFSPPDTTVEIDGRTLGQGGYQFAVIDHGVGMTDVELLSANHRIRGLDELEGMPTRYLGQYVVAKLAGKTGVMVNLQRSSGSRGVTALVNLPATALVGPTDRGVAGRPLPGSRAARDEGPAPFAPGAGLGTSIPGELVVDLPSGAALPPGVEAEPVEGTSMDEVDLSWADSVTSDPTPEPDVAESDDDATSATGTTLDDTGSSDEALGAFAAAPSYLPGPPDADADADDHDPWAAFRDAPVDEGDDLVSLGDDLVSEGDDLVSLGDGSVSEGDDLEPPAPPAPPPAPPAPPPAPVQASWLPLDGGARDPAPQPATGRSGGLARRVPGATLAQQRSGDEDAPRSTPGRSADGVRSMLASFQAGRTRGQGSAAGATATASPAEPEELDPAVTTTSFHDSIQHNDPAAESAESDAHHGRSPQ